MTLTEHLDNAVRLAMEAIDRHDLRRNLTADECEEVEASVRERLAQHVQCIACDLAGTP